MNKDGWTYKRLDEVCDKGSSNIVINKLESNEGDYPLFGASGIVRSIDFYHRDKPYIGIIKDGSGVGRVNIYPAYSSLVGTMQYILPKDDEQLKYIKYFLQKLDLSQLVTGAAIPHIYFKDYGKKMIPIPSKDTQNKIVAEFDTINESITMLHLQVKDLDSLALSIFYDMFGDPITNPKGFPLIKISEVGTVVTGNTPSTKDVENYSSNDYCFIKPSDIAKEGVSNIQTSEFFISKKAYCNSRQLPKGSVLTTCIGIIGKVGILRKDATCNQQINAIVPNSDISSVFLAYTILGLRKVLEAISNAPVVPIINKGDFSKLQIPLPPQYSQQSFANKIAAIEESKASLNAQIAEMQNLLAARMQYWFD